MTEELKLLYKACSQFLLQTKQVKQKPAAPWFHIYTWGFQHNPTYFAVVSGMFWVLFLADNMTGA